MAYGVRVQNSVFECNIDNAQYHQLMAELMTIIDTEGDSLRFYVLGNNYQNKTVHIGVKPTCDLKEPLVL